MPVKARWLYPPDYWFISPSLPSSDVIHRLGFYDHTTLEKPVLVPQTELSCRFYVSVTPQSGIEALRLRLYQATSHLFGFENKS